MSILLLAIAGTQSESMANPSSFSINSQAMSNLRKAKTDTAGIISGHKWVDLGLPSHTKWATANIGASLPGDCGFLFAWGETKLKTLYNISSCVVWNKENMTEFAGKRKYDAARAWWGGSWRMPRKQDFDELRFLCQWQWDGNGYVVTGPNGNCIYLPACGWGEGHNNLSHGTDGAYWTASPSGYNCAYFLGFNQSGINIYSDYYIYGQSIRPVSN